MKRLISLSLALLMVLSLFLTAPAARAAEGTGSSYYRSQLATEDARSIYDALVKMRDSGKLKNGNYTVDLVKTESLENKAYNRNVLTADFASAKDAFMMDNAALFYVDFDKLSISYSQAGSSHSVTLGVGRDTTYFRTGFNKDNVGGAISAFDSEVSEIVGNANAKSTYAEKVRAAYDAVVNATVYKLENAASADCIDYVRTPYGALVKGESVCEGYARALKAVLDKMGVENVLVQGAFVDDNGKPQPHMWNYVKMDDNRWYLLDPTMEDGDTSTADEYFLKSVLDIEILTSYQPDGVISLSQNSFEFAYPDLSGAAYQGLATDVFTVREDGKISYKSMGIAKTRETEKLEIIGSHNGKVWYYAWNHIITTAYDMDMGIIDPKEMGLDTDTAFQNIPGYAYVAVTSIPARSEISDKPTPAERAEFRAYTGGLENIHSISKIGEVQEYTAQPPVIVEKIPNTSRLEPGKTYPVKIVYSEKLKLTNPQLSAGLRWVTPVEGASVKDFAWDGDRTITFTLKTSSSYGYITYYYFDLENLTGVNGGKPGTICFNVVQTHSFACPRIPGDINEIQANTPALVADTNLADNNWGDTSFASDRLALVATTLTPETTQEMEDAIAAKSGKEVRASQTFDIDLTLCSSQVDYISGNRVKVFVPFPAGYHAGSDATFKAYHFDANGNAEEIPCVVTQNGIIMMCDEFSPFAVVAMDKEAVTEKSVITFTGSHGSFDEELIKLSAGESRTVAVTAEAGYRIEDVKLNGVSVLNRRAKTTGDSTTVTLDYAALKDSGNTLEASFTLKNVEVEGAEELTITPAAPEGVTITAPEGGWKEGTNSFTVTSENACVVAVTNDNGATYTRLTAISAGTQNTWSFSAALTEGSQILVRYVGDMDNSGTVDDTDRTTLKAALLNNTDLNQMQDLTMDITRDGKVNGIDLMKLRVALLQNAVLPW